MIFYFIKIIVTVIVIVIVSEVAKKSTLFAGLIVSIPLTTLLAIVWLYWETRNIQKVIELSNATLLMIIPSCMFFLVLPVLLKFNLSFMLSITLAVLLTGLCYWIYITILGKFGYAIF